MILLYDIFTLLYSFIKIFQRLKYLYEQSLKTNQNDVSTKIRKGLIIIICDTPFQRNTHCHEFSSRYSIRFCYHLRTAEVTDRFGARSVKLWIRSAEPPGEYRIDRIKTN